MKNFGAKTQNQILFLFFPFLCVCRFSLIQNFKFYNGNIIIMTYAAEKFLLDNSVSVGRLCGCLTRDMIQTPKLITLYSHRHSWPCTVHSRPRRVILLMPHAAYRIQEPRGRLTYLWSCLTTWHEAASDKKEVPLSYFLGPQGEVGWKIGPGWDLHAIGGCAYGYKEMA